MAITFVHALWGDELTATWPKILFDVQNAAQQKARYDVGELLVFAYGVHNYRYLWARGFDPILASDGAVIDFDSVGERHVVKGDVYGQMPYGVSHWNHKADAVCRALDMGASEVIWLDWDTLWLFVRPGSLDKLADGPPFQGRIRHYRRPKPPMRSRNLYHGGCYYAREKTFFEAVRSARCDDPTVSDEGLITDAVNRIHFNRKATPHQHRDAGFDSPILHNTRGNVVPGSRCIFNEGRPGKAVSFARNWGDHIDSMAKKNDLQVKELLHNG